MTTSNINIPPALAEIAAGRDNLKTTEVAKAFNVTPGTVRKNYCLTGECYGVKPKKLPNNRLNWPVLRTAEQLNRSEK